MSQTEQESCSTSYQTPRWVKVSGTIVIILILLFVVFQLVIGGEHGPNRHISLTNTTEVSTPSAEHNGQ